MKKIFILGASGHGRSILDVVTSENKYDVVGFIDSLKIIGDIYCHRPILGRERDLGNLIGKYQLEGYIVAIGDNYQRFLTVQRIEKAYPSLNLFTTIHPSAIIASDVEIDRGTVIMPRVTVISGCRIGKGCILNTASSLDHDCIMEDWSSIAPGTTTGGNVHIGTRSFLGLGSNIIQKIKIGDDTVIGAGSLVITNIPDRVVAYGSPCQAVRDRLIEEKYI